MIWPWSRIRQLERQVANLELNVVHRMKWEAQWKAIALEACNNLRGAHKGIKRLVEKVKQLKAQRTHEVKHD